MWWRPVCCVLGLFNLPPPLLSPLSCVSLMHRLEVHLNARLAQSCQRRQITPSVQMGRPLWRHWAELSRHSAVDTTLAVWCGNTRRQTLIKGRHWLFCSLLWQFRKNSSEFLRPLRNWQLKPDRGAVLWTPAAGFIKSRHLVRFIHRSTQREALPSHPKVLGGGATSAELLLCLCNDGFVVALGLSHPKGQAGQQQYNRRVAYHRGQELMPLNQLLTDAGQRCRWHPWHNSQTHRCRTLAVLF